MAASADHNRDELKYVRDVRANMMSCKCYKDCGVNVWAWKAKKAKIEGTQRDMTSAERKATMRNRLEHAFVGKNLQAQKVPLTFKETFHVKEGVSETLELCDHCFCALVYPQSPRSYLSLKADVKAKAQKDWASERAGIVETGSVKPKIKRVNGAEFDNLLEAQDYFKKHGNSLKFTRYVYTS